MDVRAVIMAAKRRADGLMGELCAFPGDSASVRLAALAQDVVSERRESNHMVCPKWEGQCAPNGQSR